MLSVKQLVFWLCLPLRKLGEWLYREPYVESVIGGYTSFLWPSEENSGRTFLPESVVTAPISVYCTAEYIPDGFYQIVIHRPFNWWIMSDPVSSAVQMRAPGGRVTLEVRFPYSPLVLEKFPKMGLGVRGGGSSSGLSLHASLEDYEDWIVRRAA